MRNYGVHCNTFNVLVEISQYHGGYDELYVSPHVQSLPWLLLVTRQNECNKALVAQLMARAVKLII